MHAIQNIHTDHPYVYILVRSDISIEQQIVQASHAALEAGFRFKKPDVTSSIVLLTVPNQVALESAAERLDRNGIDHHMFFEPDFGMGHSALATRPMVLKSERHSMRKYPLYRAPLIADRTPAPDRKLLVLAPSSAPHITQEPQAHVAV